jgi:alpha-D-xyloside xylohydrolase
VLAYPDDPACRTLDRQYLLGPDLLVAPVFSADGEVEVYLPEGGWTHLFTGETVRGPGWRRERHGFLSLPLYLREGAVLPLAAPGLPADADWTPGLTLLTAPGGPGTVTVTVPDPATGAPAATYAVTRAADGTVTATAPDGTPAQVALRPATDGLHPAAGDQQSKRAPLVR